MREMLTRCGHHHPRADEIAYDWKCCVLPGEYRWRQAWAWVVSSRTRFCGAFSLGQCFGRVFGSRCGRTACGGRAGKELRTSSTPVLWRAKHESDRAREDQHGVLEDAAIISLQEPVGSPINMRLSSASISNIFIVAPLLPLPSTPQNIRQGASV